MPAWIDEFATALQERDQLEKGTEHIYQSYSRLAERGIINALQLTNQVSPGDIHATASAQKRSSNRTREKTDFVPHESCPYPDLRSDLAESQRVRELLESRIQSTSEELRRLKIQAAIDAKKIADLSRDKELSTRGIKDRDEEIRGKAKLLENLHVETVSLTLQLNMADERVRKVEIENKDLIERWMKRMGQEAEDMNEHSQFS